MRKFTFYEFFAGGGMARAGLGDAWACVFANDFDPKKVATYAANWGADHIREADVASLTLDDLPKGRVDLAWASFPCQDLSLAGGYRGLGRERDNAPTRSGNILAVLAPDARIARGGSRAARDRFGECLRRPYLAGRQGFRSHRRRAGGRGLPLRRSCH